MRFGILALTAACGCVLAESADAQRPVDQGVRIGITYAPGTRPGLLVLGGAGNERLDSIRTIITRDLDFSDQFEMIYLPGGDSLSIGPASGNHGGEADVDDFVNYNLYAALGAGFAIDVGLGNGDVPAVTLYDVRGEERKLTLPVLAELEDPTFRRQVHRVSDDLVRATTGAPGMAATRLLWVRDRALRVVDSDGYDDRRLPTEANPYSPVWHPDGEHYAYVDFPGETRVHLAHIDSGDVRVVGAPGDGQDFAPAFSPQRLTIAFSRASNDGTDVYSYNFVDDCCLERLTIGRFSDNLSPTFSPDGRRIAYVSTRSGLPQIYVMSADGTGQELFAPFDYGITGGSYAPEWSPGGLNLAFHRDVQGSPQVFIMDVSTQTVRQLTSAGRNEDPTWAPDGRHLAFVSSRTGSSQIWIIDLETGRTRQLTRRGRARLPAWSR